MTIGLVGCGIGWFAEFAVEQQDEQHKIHEWEMAIRMWAGGRDGQRAIDWAREYHRVTAPTLPYVYPLSKALAGAYDRLLRGDVVGPDGQWMTA